IPESFQLWTLHGPLNLSFLLALVAVGVVYILLEKTDFGLRLKATSKNPEAARVSGVNVERVLLQALFLGGAFAAGASLNEVLGSFHRVRDGLSQGFGFAGIAVAFL